MDDGWVHPLAQSLPSLINNMGWNIVMDDSNLDENHLVSDSKLQHCKSIIFPRNYKEWQMMLG